MDKSPQPVTHTIETTLHETGSITVDNIPFQKGDRVKVLVVADQTATHKKKREANYPLRGKPFKFRDPFEPTATHDWDVLQ
ncbi:MAG: hypothetical protein WCT04_25795 [Planctomycetota bacterium]